MNRKTQTQKKQRGRPAKKKVEPVTVKPVKPEEIEEANANNEAFKADSHRGERHPSLTDELIEVDAMFAESEPDKPSDMSAKTPDPAFNEGEPASKSVAEPVKLVSISPDGMKFCKKCIYQLVAGKSTRRDKLSDLQCSSSDAPYTSFFYGIKEALKINTEGICKYYTEKSKE